MSFGYVIDFACGPKDRLGGVTRAPIEMAQGTRIEPDASCTACQLTGGTELSCIGVVATPISERAERWLFGRLPERIDTVAGEMLKLAVLAGSTGERGNKLRQARKLESEHPLKRSWGTVFKRFVVTTDQVIEQLLCVGDIEPPHAMAQLVQLGALAIDGRVPEELAEGAIFSELMENSSIRRTRTQLTVMPDPTDDPGIVDLKRFLRALYAAFCVDKKLLVFEETKP